MYLHIYKDADEVTTALAEWITSLIVKTLLTKDKFTLALSGGETPKSLYKKLSAAPYFEKIDWNKIHFFWGDERVVPFTDEHNNAKMAYDNLLGKLNVPEDHIHIMQTGIEPIRSAIEYEKILHKYFDDSSTTFDLVLLGMGDDGHTLSLFPNSLVLFQNNKWVTVTKAPDKKMDRITLLSSIVNKSYSLVFLIAGVSKAQSLQQVLEGEYQPEKFPAQLIKPLNNELHWFVDEAAGSLLKK